MKTKGFPDIFLLKPNRVWRAYRGGLLLDILEEKQNPQDGHFPEDWIASTVKAINPNREKFEDEGHSKVEIDGKEYLLQELIKINPELIFGQEYIKKFGIIMQFLLKFLDSAIRLNVQCHPTRKFSKKHLKSNFGKTEAYYILKIREDIEDPYIFLGFQRPPSKKKFKKSIQSQNIEEILSYFEKIYVKPGDVFIVPGGFPHAIGEGILLIELMEPTDFCVETEFEKGSYVLPNHTRFMGKNIDFALSMFNYKRVSKKKVKKRYFIVPKLLKTYNSDSFEYSIIDHKVTKCFRMKKLRLIGKIEKTEDSFYVAIVIKGSGIITTGSTKINVKYGDKFLVPFSTKKIALESEKVMELILALPPK